MSQYFGIDSPFRTAALDALVKLRACAGHHYRVSIADKCVELGVADPTADETHEFVRQTLEACGPSMKCLELGHNIVADADYSRFLKLVVKHCRNVESARLHIRKTSSDIVLDDYRQLLCQLGPQLHTLSWYCENGVAVEQFDFSACVGLKEFTFQGEKLAVLSSQLDAFGSTLEKLVVCCMDTTADWASVLDKIQSKCKNLTAICLELDEVCSVVGTERYTSFLMNFGEQLVDARVEGLQPDQLARIAAFCPNLRLSLRIEGEDSRWKAMNALKSNLKDVRIRLFRDDSVDLEFFDNTIVHCENLETLSVYLYNLKTTDNSDAMLNSIFSTSRHVLEELQFHPLLVSQESIKLVASNTSHLRKFDIESVNYIEDGAIFKDIATSNPLLEQVKVFEKVQDKGQERKAEDALEVVEQLVNSFSNCTYLNKLDLRVVINETGLSKNQKQQLLERVREQARVICRPLYKRGIDHRVWLFHDHYPFTADGGGEPGTY